MVKCGGAGANSSGEHGEAAKSVDGEHGHAGVDAQEFKVAANEGGGGGVIFDKDDFGGTTAKGFDADGAGSGEEIDESRTGYVGGQHVEKCLAQAVAGRAQGEAFGALQDAAFVRSGDDAHECSN